MLNDIIDREDFYGKIFVFLFVLTQVDARKRAWNAGRDLIKEKSLLSFLFGMTPKDTIPHPGAWRKSQR